MLQALRLTRWGKLSAASGMMRLGLAHLALLQVHALSEVQQIRLTASSSPNWSKLSSVLPFLVMLLATPIQISTFVLIIRRRHRYPIAGRGWIYLLVTCGVSTIIVFSLALVALYFPLALPCPIDYLTAVFIAFVVVAYCARSWILVCRLEVRNFLTERQWRIEKAKVIKEIKEEMAKERKQNNKHDALEMADEGRGSKNAAAKTVAAVAMNGNNEVERIRIHNSSECGIEEEEVDLSPESMQGYFFIKNRSLTRPRSLLAVCGLVVSYIVASLTAMIFLDPDVAMQREWRAQHGLPPDPEYYGSQFLQGHFVNSPVCLANSIKLYSALAVFYCAAPVGIWTIWRLWLNSKRARNRSKEQQDFQRRIQQYNGGVDASESSALASARDDMDDSQLVKQEFALCVLIALAAAILQASNDIYGKQWSCLCIMLEHLAYWIVSVALPLVRSETISRRHRRAILKSRGGDATARTKGRKSSMYAGAALPHQRPYFSLKFILHNAHTYPVLLKFLRKEYSSENALFYTEVRELKALCVQLERAMPSWPQGRDEDLGSQFAGSSGGGGGSGAGAGTGGNIGAAAASGGRSIHRPGGLPESPAPPRPRYHSGADGIPTPSLLRLPPPSISSSPLCSPDHGAAAARRIEQADTTLQQQQRQHRGSRDRRLSLPFNLPLPGSPSNGSSASMSAVTMAITPTNAINSAAESAATTARFSALHADAHRAKAWCQRIYEEFLAKSAIFEINIPDDLSALVGSQIQQLKCYEPTPLDEQTGSPRMELTTTEEPQPPPFALSLLFAATQLGILNLVETDSFRRFILTAEFRALLAAADDAEVKRRETQADLQADLQGDMAAVAALHESSLLANPLASGAGVVPILSGVGAAQSLVAPARATPTSSQKKLQATAAAAVMPLIELLPGAVLPSSRPAEANGQWAAS